jgi:hypothetical protein
MSKTNLDRLAASFWLTLNIPSVTKTVSYTFSLAFESFHYPLPSVSLSYFRPLLFLSWTITASYLIFYLQTLVLVRFINFKPDCMTMWLFVVVVVMGFKFRALCLLGRCSTTWVSPLALFCFSCFSDRVSHLFFLAWTDFWWWSSYLCLPHSWNYWYARPCPACLLGGDLVNFSHRLALNCDLLK